VSIQRKFALKPKNKIPCRPRLVPTNLHEQSLYKNCYRFTDRYFQLFSSMCDRGGTEGERTRTQTRG